MHSANLPLVLCILAQAAQLGEVYWMSLTRDVPFSKYYDHPDTIAAAGKSSVFAKTLTMVGPSSTWRDLWPP